MQRGVKCRIYPDREQENLINRIFGCCRLIYNKGLDMRKEAYENGEKVGYNQTSAMLTELKKQPDFEFLKEADSVALQQSLCDLDRGFVNFFEKRAGYPKFKAKHSTQTYRTINQNDKIRIVGGYIRLPKIGYVKIKQTMEIGHIISATIKKTPTGKFFVVLNVDFEPEAREIKNNSVGIDVGIRDFCTLSNGDKEANPEHIKKNLKKLRREQKRLSKKQKGSNNYGKQRIRVATVHENVSNQRNDFLQKLSTRLICENQTICLEDISVKDIITETQNSEACRKQKRNMNRSQYDVSWAEFFRMLEYKAKWYGNTIIKVPSDYPSSRICHSCGEQHEKLNPKIRKWKCPVCGETHDRDINAAINILNKGLAIKAIS